jgi:hypothetical protein
MAPQRCKQTNLSRRIGRRECPLTFEKTSTRVRAIEVSTIRTLIFVSFWSSSGGMRRNSPYAPRSLVCRPRCSNEDLVDIQLLTQQGARLRNLPSLIIIFIAIINSSDIYNIGLGRLTYPALRTQVKINDALGRRSIDASCVARQSATIVLDNRLALPPSLAVEYSRVFSLLAPCWRSAAAPSLLHTLFRPGHLGHRRK